MTTDEHRCSLPEIAQGVTASAQPFPWECRVCGRAWQQYHTGLWVAWQEIRGPAVAASGDSATRGEA